MKHVTAAALVGALAIAVTPGMANAHFLLMQGTDANRDPNRALDLTILFSHPFTAGPDMHLDGLQGLELTHQRGDAEAATTDLLDTVTEIEWTGSEGAVSAYRAAIPAAQLRSAGDYTIVATPEPFYEGTEDIYIQQITKLVFNIGGVPGNWDQPLGLPAEIVPLNKPYGNWVGSVFRGVVLSEGEPVPHAEIEVEYLNQDLDLEGNTWTGEPRVSTANPHLEVLSIRSDAQGNFAVSLPFPGWWGIGALGVGPQTEHEGKELSQDAVLWVYAEAAD